MDDSTRDTPQRRPLASRPVTPIDQDLIAADAEQLRSRANEFAAEFYATLFELDPSLRPLFPEDLAAQRVKLIAELDVLVARVVAVDGTDDVDRFAAHAGELGERHEVYGVEAPMYESVGVALLGALGETVDGFDDDHAAAWRRLYQLVAAAMQSS